MIDAKHDDQRRCLVDLEHDAVGAASCRVQPGELPPQRPTDAMRIVEQRSPVSSTAEFATLRAQVKCPVSKGFRVGDAGLDPTTSTV